MIEFRKLNFLYGMENSKFLCIIIIRSCQKTATSKINHIETMNVCIQLFWILDDKLVMYSFKVII